MKRARPLLLAVALALPAALAAQADPELERVRDRLARALPEVEREDVRRSAAPGLFEVRVGHAFGYVTADGRHLVSGDLIDLDSGVRVTEQRRREERVNTVAGFADQAIVFAPPPERLRYWVTIFTDTDCEYCRMLHREVPEMNERGIGVRYLFFSKYGAPSDAFKRAQYVWCSADRNEALTRGLLTGKVQESGKICDNPVLEQYLAARGMGLKGTPVAILPSGKVFYGYVNAEGLLAQLEQPADADPDSGSD